MSTTTQLTDFLHQMRCHLFFLNDIHWLTEKHIHFILFLFHFIPFLFHFNRVFSFCSMCYLRYKLWMTQLWKYSIKLSQSILIFSINTTDWIYGYVVMFVGALKPTQKVIMNAVLYMYRYRIWHLWKTDNCWIVYI